MKIRQGYNTHIFHTAFLIVIIMLCADHTVAATGSTSVSEFPPDLQSYNDAGKNILQQLIHRVTSNPFNIVGSLIFLLAIIHTFLASKFTAISHQLEHEHNIKKEQGLVPRNSVAQSSRFMHFMGEIEVVFGLWAVALIVTIVFFYDWGTAVDYMIHKVNFTEALFVVVIMTLASTRPILKLSEIFMNKIATLLGGIHTD